MIALSDIILVLLLLYNAAVPDSHGVPILSSAASSASRGIDSNSKDDLIKLVTYERFASIIPQRDQGSSISLRSTLSLNAVVSLPRRLNRTKLDASYNKANRRKISTSELRDFKWKNKCTRSSKYGHWVIDHLDNKKIWQCFPSIEAPPPGVLHINAIAYQIHATNSAENTRLNAVLKFNTAFASQNLWIFTLQDRHCYSIDGRRKLLVPCLMVVHRTTPLVKLKWHFCAPR